MKTTGSWLGAAALLLAGCTPERPPPEPLQFAGLPVTGDLALARRAGFTRCVDMDAVHMRCRRAGVMLYGRGPYEAAVDLRGRGGRSGFDHVTLWHGDDGRKLYDILATLKRDGWRTCITGTNRAGDQAVFTRAGAPVWISLDISYYGKRRLRIFPAWMPQRLSTPCVPNVDLGIFNVDV